VCRHRLATYRTESAPLIEHYAPVRLDFVVDGGVGQCLPRLVAALRARETAVAAAASAAVSPPQGGSGGAAREAPPSQL
jgi:hypothetical protein